MRIADLSGFALGRRTRQLAGADAAPDPVDHHAVLEELREQVRFGIHLASFAGGRVRLVDRDPDHELSGENTIAAHLHASAIGKILLASRPDLVPSSLRRVTSRTVTDIAALRVNSTPSVTPVRPERSTRCGWAAAPSPSRCTMRRTRWSDALRRSARPDAWPSTIRNSPTSCDRVRPG